MNKFLITAVILSAACVLSGCETIKSTVKGSFIGMKKDKENITNVVKDIHPEHRIQRLDEWIKKNMW